MISSRYNFIFVHVPKTGGNAIQTVLLPVSDDRKIRILNVDDTHTFEVRGERTIHKHASLSDYTAKLGEAIGGYRTIIGVRDPLERALSHYYSPSRLLRRGETGETFVMNDFIDLTKEMKTLKSFLMVDGKFVAPDFVIRFSHLSSDFVRVFGHLGVPVSPLERINESGDVNGLRAGLRNDPEIAAIVRERFAEDYDCVDLLTERAARQFEAAP